MKKWVLAAMAVLCLLAGCGETAAEAPAESALTYDALQVTREYDFAYANQVAAEALNSGTICLPDMSLLTLVKGEQTFGNSRFDFYVEDADGKKGYLEVKGVTLEEDGLVRFPDAPTERGVKHVEELIRAREEGYCAFVLFIVQMEGMRVFMPNDDTHRAFGDALRRAQRAGVHILAYQCHVTEDSLQVSTSLPVRLNGEELPPEEAGEDR